MIRIPLNKDGPWKKNTYHNLIDNISIIDPVVKQQNPDVEYGYLINTVNEPCWHRDEIQREIAEAKALGHDVMWVGNDTAQFDQDQYGIWYNHFENQCGAFHDHGLCTESMSRHNLTTGLYLPGNSSKEHRLAPIKYLHDAGLLEDFKYSLKVPVAGANIDSGFWHRLEASREYFVTLENDLDVDLNSCVSLGPNKNIMYAGYPYDPCLYSSTGWSLISESFVSKMGNNGAYADVPWITEKTYRTIYNRHPFIMTGESGIHEYLKRMGYKTFEKFYGISVDDFWPGIDGGELHHQCKQLVKVVKEFKQNLITHSQEITDMVIHNKQNLINRYQETRSRLKNMNQTIYCDHIWYNNVIAHGDRPICSEKLSELSIDLKNDELYIPLEDFLWKIVSYQNPQNKNLLITDDRAGRATA
jgi:hypothetical protein